MNWQEQNVGVYNNSAVEMSAYLSGIGPRIKDIERGLILAGKQDDASVIELGCGDGRDAIEIIKRVRHYIGIDPSEGLLNIAKNNNPNDNFVLADAISYEYPMKLDVIFAFASLLHINQDDICEVFNKAKDALRLGGIFYISLRERSNYTEEIAKDQFGKRMFYYYNPSIIIDLAGSSFESVYEDHQTIGHTDWFTIALKKKTI
jgi:SAM-dependent methyltransferase